ncbi:MAG: hypothetical protein ACRD5Z_13125 [Bryobacteraceae bacterium]
MKKRGVGAARHGQKYQRNNPDELTSNGRLPARLNPSFARKGAKIPAHLFSIQIVIPSRESLIYQLAHCPASTRSKNIGPWSYSVALALALAMGNTQ